MAKTYHFSEEDKTRIKEAVKESEKVSCGEIVPYFVSSSDDYAEASWYSSTLLGSLAALLIAILSYNWLLPFKMTPLEVALIILGALLVGFIIPKILPASKRWFISKSERERRVQQRANQAFLDEKIFETEERVGILIFISRLEHQVLVLGDEGINKKVKPEDWQQIVDSVIQGIKKNKIAEGLIEAIGKSKDLLLQHGFVRKSTDFNELSDDLRIED